MTMVPNHLSKKKKEKNYVPQSVPKDPSLQWAIDISSAHTNIAEALLINK